MQLPLGLKAPPTLTSPLTVTVLLLSYLSEQCCKYNFLADFSQPPRDIYLIFNLHGELSLGILIARHTAALAI